MSTIKAYRNRILSFERLTQSVTIPLHHEALRADVSTIAPLATAEARSFLAESAVAPMHFVIRAKGDERNFNGIERR